ncbi:MAG: hypothetical protein H7070_01140 [Saprospiraceae bacterium]|nr:hypothetical protein [Pyrinomonadaceae bacterium]
MKNQKITLSILFTILIFSGMVGAQTAKVDATDLNRLTGAEWKGTLTYLDYSSNKKTSIASNLTVIETPGDHLSWTFDFKYPDEPKADKRSTVTLSPDGRTFDGETVIEKTYLSRESLKIVTTQRGTDNDKKAVFRYTYLFAPASLSIKKEVRLETATEYFERNEYSWKR